MTQMNIERFDLNLLTVFDAVFTARSVTAASIRLGMPQPTVSRALGRLRTLLGDPLFVRTAKGMRPTAVAENWSVKVTQALAMVDEAVKGSSKFDPSRVSRTFRLLVSDIGEVDFIPKLYAYCNEQAPAVSIQALQLPHEQYAAALQSGAADVAIGDFPDLKAGFYRRRLFTNSYVCISRRGVLADAERISMDRYLAALHVQISPPGKASSPAPKVPSVRVFKT